MDLRNIGATAVLTTMFLGVFGFLGVMVISNSSAIAIIEERNRGLAKEVSLMRTDISGRLDKIDKKLDTRYLLNK